MTADTTKYEYNHVFNLDGEEFHVRSMIPYTEKEKMA